jgi:hypothetical protein
MQIRLKQNATKEIELNTNQTQQNNLNKLQSNVKRNKKKNRLKKTGTLEQKASVVKLQRYRKVLLQHQLKFNRNVTTHLMCIAV